MDNARMQQSLSRRVTKWSKHQLPGWWTVFQVLIGVVFFGYLAFSLISGEKDPAPVALPPAAPATTAPAPSTDSPAAMPTSTSTGDTAVPASGSTKVPGADGKPVSVPAQAAAVALQSFHALFDPKAAAALPVVNGQRPSAPGVAFPKHTVRSLQLISPDAAGARLVFQAVVDPDGKGPLRGDTVARTVELSGDAWQLNPAG